MTFLAPLFFLALAGLAIPVLLHLTQREKKQIVHFPSLMFVRRIPYQSVRRRKVHNWLLLAIRLAALALIILAFARPFINREVVILLDTSYSMGQAGIERVKNESFKELVDQADAAMYQCKRHKRKQIKRTVNRKKIFGR